MSIALTLDLRDRRVLCVGDSARLCSKAERLADAGARLYWWQQQPSHWGSEMSPETVDSWQEADPDVLLVDLDDADERQAWIDRAEGERLFGWFRGAPEASRLQFPSVIERGPLRVALDTGGLSPSVSRWLRQRVEQLLPDGLGELLERARRHKGIEERLETPHQRRSFWYRLLDSRFAHRAALSSPGQTDEMIEETLTRCAEREPKGQVFLVGAGPGDPDLLTTKALRLLGEADVVLHDRLVSQPIMDLIRADAEIIHVGKARSNHSVPQQRINEMLVEQARLGKTVLRLKGGDPFIFGRGGEEIETLAEEGVDFQVVPGITAASGCATYSGIPLTHRDHAQSVRFVTGHLKDNSTDLPWDDLVQDGQTLVLYMGLVGLPIITRELVRHGMSPDMPVALISKGTLPQQTVVSGTLSNIVDRVDDAKVRAPTLIIVGSVVSLRERLDWVNRLRG